MGRKPVAKRLELQEKDDGDLDDEVVYQLSIDSRHYHSTEDCRILKGHETETDTATRKELQRTWYAPCTECIL